jgi:hypothetical protein
MNWKGRDSSRKVYHRGDHLSFLLINEMEAEGCVEIIET